MGSSGVDGSKRAARVAILGQRKWYKEKKNSATCICMKLYAFQDTVIHCFIFLPSPLRDDPFYTQWEQRGKGTCPRLHSKLLVESAKAFTPWPESFYHVLRNEAPGRWLWR